MVMKRMLWVSIVTMVISTTEIATGAIPTGKTFPTLTIGATTYTNLTITDVSGGSIFLRHSRGFESLRIDSLDSKTLSELGVEAPAPRSPGKAAGKLSEAASPNRVSAKSHPADGGGDSAWNPFADGSTPLKGSVAVVVYGLAAVGLILLIAAKILFLVAAFRAGPWWGIGVLFGGFTCGIVPLIFFFTHLEECKRSFVIGVAGLLLFLGLAITVPNYVRAREAAQARKKQAMILQTHPAWA